MKASGSDRRVKYTKTVLKDALVQLMKGQHISSISIKSLCEIADINRSTFYTHYSDQYDLLHQIEQDVMANLKLHLEKQEYVDNLPVTSQAMTRILEYAKENADLFNVLLSENCDFAFQKDVLALSEIVSWQYNKALDSRTMEYLQAYATTGCISLLHKWLKDGTVESVPVITELILKVLYRGIVSFQ
jgi:AcrR family transcriptional regulator